MFTRHPVLGAPGLFHVDVNDVSLCLHVCVPVERSCTRWRACTRTRRQPYTYGHEQEHQPPRGIQRLPPHHLGLCVLLTHRERNSCTDDTSSPQPQPRSQSQPWFDPTHWHRHQKGVHQTPLGRVWRGFPPAPSHAGAITPPRARILSKGLGSRS